jgi:hypothetical protein
VAQFKERFRSSVLQPLDEEAEEEGGAFPLPARLKHLKGPMAMPMPAPPTPASLLQQQQQQEEDPTTPSYAAESALFNRLKREHDVADEDDCSNVFNDFNDDEGDDEMELELDQSGLTREQMMEDALTGRASAAAASRTPSRAGRAAPGPAGRRTLSAPAAVTRRIGPARVATRRRTSMTVKRQTLEKLANMRRETNGGGSNSGGGGGGKYGGGKNVSATVRNQGPRNTMGMRCMQPRSGGMM